MRDLVLAIVVSALVSAGISYWMTRNVQPQAVITEAARNATPRQTPTIIHVIVSRNGNQCIATTDPWRQSFGEGPIHWVIHRAAKNVDFCFRDGQSVKIVPKSGNTSPLTPSEPYDSRLIRARHANVGARYFYEVVMQDASGTTLYVMEDPELEIVEM